MDKKKTKITWIEWVGLILALTATILLILRITGIIPDG